MSEPYTITGIAHVSIGGETVVGTRLRITRVEPAVTHENISTLDISHGIYIEGDALGPGELRISCNFCSTEFFNGVQEDASDKGNSWLGDAVTHLMIRHSDDMPDTAARKVSYV